MGVIADAGRNEEGVRSARPARVHVVSAAIVREGRVLLAQRAFTTLFPLAWCTPGGKVEHGETDVAALRRELAEELGVSLKLSYEPSSVFDVDLDPPTVSRPVRVTCYRVDWTGFCGEPRPLDGTAGLGWFDASGLLTLNLTPSDRASRQSLVAALSPESPLVRRVWGYSRTGADEHYDGAYDSREEAIDAGRDEYGDEPFYVIEGKYPDAAGAMPDAGRVLDWMHDHAGEQWADSDGDWPDTTAEAQADLDALLATWARKHAPVTRWIGVGEPERIEPIEPLASVRASGDAGHEATCARDHLMPGVCSVGEEVSNGR
jgi:8-oxo-dGTP diphosphatase